MECPHCHNKIEAPDLWEFFDCTNCSASLQLENNELKILKVPDENTASNQQPLQKNVEENQNTSPVEEKPHTQNLPDKDSHSTDDIFLSGEEEVSQSMDDQTKEPLPDTAPEDFSETPHADTPQPLESFSETSNEQSHLENETNSADSEENENLSNILDFESSPHQGNHFTYCLQISEISSNALLNKIHHIFKKPSIKNRHPPSNAKQRLSCK